MKAQIVLATHNPPPALFTRQMGSLLAQDEPDWQCLVFDDSSGDRRAVVAALSDPRFVVLPPREHLGAYRAFEYLLSQTDDVPVLLCDQDDYWHPQKLSTLLDTPGTVYSAMRVVDETGAVIRDRYLPPPSDLSPAGLLLMNRVSGAALKITPAVRDAALPFPAPGLRGWHDQWLAVVAARLGELLYLNEPLVDYTQHASQVVGDGLLEVSVRRVRRFLRKPQLRDRTDWVMAAAYAALHLPGGPDPDLAEIATGRWASVLARHDIPRQRSLLLRAGYRI